jgi:hypothetical protein
MIHALELLSASYGLIQTLVRRLLYAWVAMQTTSFIAVLHYDGSEESVTALKIKVQFSKISSNGQIRQWKRSWLGLIGRPLRRRGETT